LSGSPKLIDLELEKKVEERLRRAVLAVGGAAYKFTSPGRRSVPDRLVILPGGHMIFVEVKRAGEPATKAQQMEHARLRDLGCKVYVVAGMREVQLFIDEVLHAKR